MRKTFFVLRKTSFLFLLFVVLVVTSGTTTYAVEVYPQDFPYSRYEIAAGIVPGFPKDPSPRLDEISSRRSPVVCVMRIYSDNVADSSVDVNNNLAVGHSFLTFLNVSSSNIKVGSATIAPSKMISVGKFGNFKENAMYNGKQYKGAFYNVETQRKSVLGFYQTAVSTYVDLTANELSIVSNYISNHESGYSLLTENCAQFASRTWNTVVGTTNDKHMDTFSSPYDVRVNIESSPGYTSGNGLLLGSYSRCFYVSGTAYACNDPYIQ